MADPVQLVLTIEAALLPGWFDEIRRLAPAHLRRFGVIEKPEEWVVLCELDADRVEGFHDALQLAWDAYQKTSGT